MTQAAHDTLVRVAHFAFTPFELDPEGLPHVEAACEEVVCEDSNGVREQSRARRAHLHCVRPRRKAARERVRGERGDALAKQLERLGACRSQLSPCVPAASDLAVDEICEHAP